jgi:hypothetical protein
MLSRHRRNQLFHSNNYVSAGELFMLPPADTTILA